MVVDAVVHVVVGSFPIVDQKIRIVVVAKIQNLRLHLGKGLLGQDNLLDSSRLQGTVVAVLLDLDTVVVGFVLDRMNRTQHYHSQAADLACRNQHYHTVVVDLDNLQDSY